ncbi:type II secretion system GspH family protein [Burkholderiaceae bacterium DAT-1]|nr:type II secretion system GspH family protein [Burkholderiaceae bacterium DAT-1]
MWNQRGFTLFESLVVIIIMGVVLLFAALLSKSWRTNSRLATANTQVQSEVLHKLRATALRNPGAITDSSAAAAFITISGTTISLYACSAATCKTNADNVLLWKTSLPAGVSASIGGGSKTCLALTSRGGVTTSPDATTCIGPSANGSLPLITVS